MKLERLFDLSLEHTYYADRRCPDVAIEPTAATEKLLKNHHCVLKKLIGGIKIYSTVDDQRKLYIPLREKAVFSFRLQVLNQEFFLFTDFAHIPEPPGFPIYTNNTNAPVESGELSVISLPSKPPRCFAEAQIHFASSLPSMGIDASSFKITFPAKKALWEYYVVTNVIDEGANFTIKIPENEHAIDFNEYTELNPADNVVAMLKQQYPTTNKSNMKKHRIFHFVSNQLIACHQKAKKDIQLKLNDSTLLANLPNPSVRNYTKAKTMDSETAQDSLFQIIKYITHPITFNGV